LTRAVWAVHAVAAVIRPKADAQETQTFLLSVLHAAQLVTEEPPTAVRHPLQTTAAAVPEL